MIVAWAELPITDSKATQIVANARPNVILGFIERPLELGLSFVETYF
jgi:hypothetical protein